MNYHQAIDYLKDLTKFGSNLGLSRIQELLRLLGNPEQKLKVIHIGGTNGKGSTTTFIASILQEAGLRVGTFTSPHLHCYTERFRINGQNIAGNVLAELISRMQPLLDEMVSRGFEHPTEFEVSTALALTYFQEAIVDIVILEVGLGGRIDSTNVVKPLVSVITNVAMDHMDVLGQTLPEIAQEKAGIVKAGVPVVTAAAGEALRVIEKQSVQLDSPLYRFNEEFRITSRTNKDDGQRIKVATAQQNWPEMVLTLKGEHQSINAASAVQVIDLMICQGFVISSEAVKIGLLKARWPARFEIMQSELLVVLDGAHNLAGAKALKATLNEEYPDGDFVFVLGMLADKERSQVVAELVPGSQCVIVTKPNNPRAGDWEALAEEVKKQSVECCMIREDIHQAIRDAIEFAKVNSCTGVCITGSLYMVAEARKFWFK